MAIFLIQCAMRSETHDYAGLHDLMAQSDSRPMLDGSWVIETIDDLKAVTEITASRLAPNDPLFVVEIPPRTPWSAVRMDRGTTDWLRRRRP